ncbi:MAG: DUF5916 domain-containing protein [Bacteroidota bacterium]
MRALFIFVMLAVIHIGEAQELPKRKYFTQYIGDNTAPKIDGRLDDESWAKVEWSGDYIELSPEENTSPTEPTKFKILYDKKFLYVGFRCYDEDPEGVVRRMSRRDGFDGDWVEINIDSFHDLRTAFSFTISASGVRGEEFITNNGASWDNTWNPIWMAKTNVDEEGWTAEVKIPLSQLRFSKSNDQIWGIQSTRRYFRKEERSVWQRNPQDSPGWVSEFGELHGLDKLRPQRQVEIQPYVVTSRTTFEPVEGDPFTDGEDYNTAVGLDGKIGVTNDLTLDFTIHPDFGQVEADPSAIALDGFQIFFQERRPFFIENNNIYNYPFSQSKAWLPTGGIDNLFYSRRIGRSPQGFASGQFVAQPTTTDIIGAAKFSGKTKNGWSIGILESYTAEETARMSDGSAEESQIVEPGTNYFVSRIQRDFNDNNTFIGGIFTAVNRNITESTSFLHESAYTGGLDITHQWKNRAYYLKGNFVFSDVNGSTDAITRTQQSITRLFQRVDADHVEVKTDLTSLSGTGGTVQYGKASGNWLYETGLTYRSPELELNDLGFQLLADDIRYYAWVQYRTTKPLEKVRSYQVNYSQIAMHDFQGNFNGTQLRINGWVNFNNNWWINGGTNIAPVRYSTNRLRGGPRLRRQGWYDYSVGIISDSRKKLRLNATYRWQHNFNADNHYRDITSTLTYQPTNALQLSLAPFYSWNYDQLQFITNTESNGDPRYINGTVSQQTLRVPLRIDYIITPDLSIQYWGQPFISRGTFKEFKHVNDPLASSFEDRFVIYDEDQLAYANGSYEVDENRDGVSDFSFYDPDFSFVQFRSNLVLRWEYIPGSELYLVWSQDVATAGSFEDQLAGTLRDGLADTQPQNIFLIKATYRFMK